MYCKDGRRYGSHEHTSFTFLGFTFRPRRARGRNGKQFLSFLPAVSTAALVRLGAEVRSWRLNRRTERTLTHLAHMINPIVRGWMNYYGAFYKSALYRLLTRINAYLLRWIRKKYKRFRARRPAQRAWRNAVEGQPRLFAHWAMVNTLPAVW